jgi:UDP-N-acetylmuramoylalanine--D-glutamate ligase
LQSGSRSNYNMIDARRFVKTLGGKPAAVFGLGRSGLSAVKALRAAGTEVLAWDDTPAAREKDAAEGAEIAELTQEVLKGCGCLVLSPGVPLHYPVPHPVVKAARAADVEILCDIEILHRCGLGRQTIGVTGTNGKSTTTALIGHILKEAGRAPSVGGNIGAPVLDLYLPPENGAFVLELSSYQLDLCPSFAPDIAVLLNITPDHIDRHGSLENYACAKERIFSGPGLAVISIDDEDCMQIYERVKSFGRRKVISISIKDDLLRETMEAATLKGEHNYQNALAAWHVCRAMGVQEEVVRAGLRSFLGLAHRQFLVRTVNGIAYVNDSKATNAEAAGRALASYENIYWIAGGRAKEGGLNGLEPLMDRVRHAFLIGEAAMGFRAWLEKENISCTLSHTLEEAFAGAHALAQNAGSGTVLLSPACASFDQFSSFEERGEHFGSLVQSITEGAAA